MKRMISAILAVVMICMVCLTISSCAGKKTECFFCEETYRLSEMHKSTDPFEDGEDYYVCNKCWNEYKNDFNDLD